MTTTATACRRCGTTLARQTVEHSRIEAWVCNICEPSHIRPAVLGGGHISEYPFCPHCDRVMCKGPDRGCRTCRSMKGSE